MTTLTRPPSDRVTAKGSFAATAHGRRTNRRIVRETQAHIREQLHHCLGQPIINVVAHPSGLLSVALPGYQLHLADVGAAAQGAIVALSRTPCLLTAGGQYGRFWWLTITQLSTDHPSPATALGSQLIIRATRSEQHDEQPEL